LSVVFSLSYNGRHMSRSWKQLIYGGFYLGILLLVAMPFYDTFLRPRPSCSDGILNQGEEGVDCGAVCRRICLPPDLEPLALAERPRIFLPIKDHLSVLIRFRNPNPEHGATFQYKLSLEDSVGKILGVTSQDDFLFPSQIKYVLLPNFTLDDVEKVTQANIEISSTNWVPQTFVTQPKVVLRNEVAVDEGDVVRVRGRVVNEDIRLAESVNIVALIANQWGGTIGSSATILENLEPGEVREFSISHPKLPNINLSETRVFVSAK
jgi:hypothetical protein